MLKQPDTYTHILAHAKAEYPRECCGVVIIFKGREKYIPCRNVSPELGNFIIDKEDYANAEDIGEIVKIVHSHPSESPNPSAADLVAIEQTGIPWIIVNPLTEVFTETSPSGYKAPLIGRPFYHGLLDCYALVRDYYKSELNIDLPNYTREADWWDKGFNLYTDNLEHAGFRRVSDLQKHDMIVMYLNSRVPNHAGVYLGDGIILHHVQGRLSSRDVYGGSWLKNTWCYARHVDMYKSI